MQFSVLGPVCVRNGRTTEIPLRGRKQTALLALLLSRANQPVPVDLAIDLLWGPNPPDSARNLLRWHVHGLRQSLGGQRVVHSLAGYAVRLRPGELDAEVFEQDCRRGTALFDRGEFDACARALDEALARWRGQPYAEVGSGLEPEIARLEELHLAAAELQAEADLALGRVGAALSRLRPLVGENPLCERFRALLMVALHRAGRQAEALEQYRQARLLLAEELGLEPGLQLRQAQEVVLNQR
jgi:DNA-binding SARP family transcriptional activator